MFIMFVRATHFMKNPVKGGSPAIDRMDNEVIMVDEFMMFAGFQGLDLKWRIIGVSNEIRIRK